jgi:hypothetical protein
LPSKSVKRNQQRRKFQPWRNQRWHPSRRPRVPLSAQRKSLSAG